MLLTGREVRVGKTAPEVLSTPEAEGREPYSKLRPQFFLYADGPRPVNKLLFFLLLKFLFSNREKETGKRETNLIKRPSFRLVEGFFLWMQHSL